MGGGDVVIVWLKMAAIVLAARALADGLAVTTSQGMDPETGWKKFFRAENSGSNAA